MKKETIEKILNFLKEKEGKGLPRNWNIVEKLENHPDGVQYRHEGDLVLRYSNITKLPNDLYVKGGLFLFNSKQITKLPDKLHVGGGLDIRGCNQITELPNNLHVGGDLYIKGTPLSKKYSHEEIREMITSKGGTLIGRLSK